MPVKIHGKQYFTVAERLIQLNENTDGNYTLTSEMVYFRDNMVVFKATLEVGENTYTGHALEKENSSTINKTSYVEVCETSAIGRALASSSYLGTEFASADEMVVALKNQSSNEGPATEKQINYIKKLVESSDIEIDESQYEKMTKYEANKIITDLTKDKANEG